MLKVSNRKCVRRLGFRSMKAARTRNIIAVLAIALTTMLFTSLFTIAASINYSYQQENFRRAGGDAHGSIKNITWEQVEDLRDDPLIVDSWARMFVGMPSDPPFNKSHVEVSYVEPNGASHYFCTPVEGTLPLEGTDQAAADTRILGLLGVEPMVGAQFTVSFYIDENTIHRTLITRTYTLSGWWKYDSAMTASHLLVPRSEAEAVTALSAGGADSQTGIWSLDMMFRDALSIEGNIQTVLMNHGYQDLDESSLDSIRTGVNWGYTGTRFSGGLAAGELLAIAALLALIVFTGYLIIYNVFQISVTNDIRFYGMLKTIGATGKQLKRIIRQQALLLSLTGIPLGLLFGFLIGNRLTPVIMSQLSYTHAFVSFNPWIFIGAAAFALLTVFLSCARPGRMAARVSPVEAVRYTEGGGGVKKALRRGTKGASLARMAWASLGRSRGKTAVTVVSLTLAVVLACLTYTFATGFDMDKYLAGTVAADFIVGHAEYFQDHFGSDDAEEQAVTEEIISAVNAQGGITNSGRVYGTPSTAVQQFVSEAWFRQNWGMFNSQETVDIMTAGAERLPDGRLVGGVQLYGMEEFPMSKLTVMEGNPAPLSDPAQNAVAAVYRLEDGEVDWDTAWARVGDTVTLRYVEEWEYYYTDTGEAIEALDNSVLTGERPWSFRAKTFRTADYMVCAIAAVPSALSYRYAISGADSYVMGAEQFLRDAGTSNVMTYVYDTAGESNAAMEDFLARYTETVQPEYDYESRATCAAEFQGFQNMFLVLGSTLSLIIGLVGVLNFINAILTGILTRKRELATLQSIGMTGRQLKLMLVYEGLYYGLLALGLSLLLTAAAGPLAGETVTGLFWFFTYRFTVMPILLLAPIFALLGAAVPLAVYRWAARSTIVERLREAEG